MIFSTGVEIQLNLDHVDDLSDDDYPRFVNRLWNNLAELAEAAEVFIVDTKLRLPGLAVDAGGESGPAPGQALEAVLHRGLGGLAQSIVLSVRKSANSGEFFAEVGVESGMIYSATHEFGYPPFNIPARPFVSPALEFMAEKIEPLFEKVWRQSIAAGGLA